jgi:hypothetical protein
MKTLAPMCAPPRAIAENDHGCLFLLTADRCERASPVSIDTFLRSQKNDSHLMHPTQDTIQSKETIQLLCKTDNMAKTRGISRCELRNCRQTSTSAPRTESSWPWSGYAPRCRVHSLRSKLWIAEANALDQQCPSGSTSHLRENRI